MKTMTDEERDEWLKQLLKLKYDCLDLAIKMMQDGNNNDLATELVDFAEDKIIKEYIEGEKFEAERDERDGLMPEEVPTYAEALRANIPTLCTSVSGDMAAFDGHDELREKLMQVYYRQAKEEMGAEAFQELMEGAA